MKKAILLFGFAAVSFAAQAQVNDEFKSFKPTKGDVTTELGLAGGLNNADFKLNESGLLRFRYFVKENLAFRLGVNVSSNSNTEKFYDAGSAEGKKVTRNNGVLLNLGIEKHFSGTPRLSPYVAGDILLGLNGGSVKMDNTDGNVYISQVSSKRTGPGTFSFGVRGVVGADYYIAKHVYVGAEAGLGVLNSIEGKTKTTTTIPGKTTTVETKSAGSTMELNPSVITGIRIGFVF